MTRTAQMESVNVQWIFRGYAVIAFVGGLAIAGWGQQWFGDHLVELQWGRAALIRLFGGIIMAAACFAAGLAAVEEPRAQKQGLFWFAVGHFVVCLVTLSQSRAIWGSGVSDTAGRFLFAVAFVLYYFWTTFDGQKMPSPILTLFHAQPESNDPLRSRYEEQIRAAARQEERNRLARDLHDSIKQQIFVIQTSAATAQARFGGDEAGTKQALDQVRDSAREAMAEMEVMLSQMAAAPLENTGLVEALKKQCEAFGFRTGAAIDFQLGELPPSNSLPAGAHEGLLRMAQEALSNVARHARASKVDVSLGAAGVRLQLVVKDNGAGFDPLHARRGQGLSNMRARVEEFGGTFEVTSRPAEGTTVKFSAPFEHATPAAAYKRRALEAGVTLAACVAIQMFWLRSPSMLIASTIAAVWTLRYVVAYYRVMRQAQ